MASRIAPRTEAYFPKAKSKKDKGYLAWLHQLPCVVTGRYGVEAAHLSYANPRYGHYGRARGTKASDLWALPLCPEEHRIQHSGSEITYWSEVGENPHSLAVVLWAIYSQYGDEGTPFAVSAIMQRINDRGKK